MGPDEAARFISERVRVDRVDIVTAKAFVLNASEVDTMRLADAWVNERIGMLGKKVRLDADQPERVLEEHSKAIALRLACFQGIWELVASGLLFPAGPSAGWTAQLGWETPRGGGGLSLDHIRFNYLEKVVRPLTEAPSTLADADLFLRELDLPDLEQGVSAALALAVSCLRRDLFVPALAMLAAAAEGAWIESGKALVEAATRQDRAVQKARDVLTDDLAGIGQKVQVVTDLYIRQDLFQEVRRRSEVSVSQLQEVASWTSVVRDSRNVLHWGRAAAIRNDYAKTASLLMAAVQAMKTLESIRLASKAVAADSNQGGP